jgi:predicted RND superfamily exporter protein
MVSTELLLVDKNLPQDQVSDMLEEIENVDGVGLTLSYSKITSALDMPEEFLPEEVLNIFTSDKYQMIIVSSKYENATDELNEQIAKINDIVKSYDENSLMAGEGPLMKDLVEIANHDFNSVNTFSIIVIFILMFVVLQSVSLPVILIIVIEFAIFINLGIPAFTGTKIPFVASITIGTIQLGATIDYAILITNKYILKRKEGLSKRDSIDFALETSISSIVVSGLCFFGATFGVGMYSEIEMISALCVLISRGAIISMITVILALPAFLMIFDKIICKTTLGMKKIEGKRD